MAVHRATRLVIGHYHLEPGGVSRVIESQARSLAESALAGGLFEELVVLVGHAPRSTVASLEKWAPCARLLTAPELDYQGGEAAGEAIAERAEAIRTLLERALGPNGILHFHNPNLGKNPALTMAIAKLAHEGRRVVLHCHDFPEDRPANLALLARSIGERALAATLYPRAASSRYAALTQADCARLLRAGLRGDQVWWLPNPVTLPPESPAPLPEDRDPTVRAALGVPDEKQLLLYPVRAIPRKNLAEAILLSVLFAERASCAVTLPPHNPDWGPAYERWRDFAAEVRAPIAFEVGLRFPLATLMRAADRALTTSVREGFGMVFLEPWLYGRPVVGRRIASVVDDFERSGIVFDGLYESIPVQRGAADCDFPELDEDEQRAWIAALASDRARARTLVEKLGLERRLLAPIPETTIRSNRALIEREYSLERYARRLEALYRGLLD